MHVLIAGGGLAGLSAAKYLTDAGHRVTVVEKRTEAGGKASSWQDADGDWLKAVCMCSLGPIATCTACSGETGLDANLDWKAHEMTFSRPGGGYRRCASRATSPPPPTGWSPSREPGRAHAPRQAARGYGSALADCGQSSLESMPRTATPTRSGTCATAWGRVRLGRLLRHDGPGPQL